MLFIIVLFPLSGQDSEHVFTVNFTPDNLMYNPIYSYTTSEAQLYTALFEGLVTYHPSSLAPLPGVARDWDISEDGLTYTFYLRDARYSNGDPVTSDNFKLSWIEILRPENNASYSFLFDIIAGAKDFRTGKNSDPETIGIAAPGPNELRITLDKPASHFLKILCHHSFAPVHPENLFIRNLTDSSEVIGNGPYFISDDKSRGITLRKNEKYWDTENVFYDEIKLMNNRDDQEVTKMFNRNEIQWVPHDWDLLEVQFQDSVQINPMFATTYFFIVSGEEPFQDPAVRKGMALLMPWDEIRDPEKFFTPAQTLVPFIFGYPEIEGLSQDVEKGLDLLAEAGYPGGKGLGEIVFKIPPDEVSRETSELMAEALKEHLQVTTRLNVVTYDTYFDDLEKKDYTFGTLTWIGDFADPLTFLQMWTTDSNLNDADFMNEEFDTLVEDSMDGENDNRYELLAEAERILIETGVVLPISHSPAVNLIDLDRVGGWYPNPLDIHPFKHLKAKSRGFDPSVVFAAP
jgi:peptide/nickel transport system substrate-binding protein/oligopeptide transport system substrate-binding protein